MSQHDMVIDNQSRTAARADINAALQALASTSKGTGRPSTAYQGQLWLDDNTPSASVWTLYLYDGGDDIALGTFDTVANTFTASSSETAFPIGGTCGFYGDTAPTNFAFVYGQALSRTTYATLFARLGTKYGAGDGSTTFNLPDRRGRGEIGRDDMGGSAAGRVTAATLTPDGVTLGATGGEQTHTLVTGEVPAHSHTIDVDTAPDAAGTVLRADANGIAMGTKTTNASGGGGGAHNNLPPGIVCNVIIRVL